MSQNSAHHNTPDRVRMHRQGNLTFNVHGTFHLDKIVSGQGCKKTPAWETNLTKEEIDLKIKEFWETRVDGSPRMWEALKHACEEADPKKSEILVKASGLRMNEGFLLLSYDDRGHRYELPPYVINPAIKYSEKMREEIPVAEGIPEVDYELVFRSTAIPDYKMNVNTTDTIRDIKKAYLSNTKFQKDVRMFFQGKELKDGDLLGKSHIANHLVVQVFPKGQ